MNIIQYGDYRVHKQKSSLYQGKQTYEVTKEGQAAPRYQMQIFPTKNLEHKRAIKQFYLRLKEVFKDTTDINSKYFLRVIDFLDIKEGECAIVFEEFDNQELLMDREPKVLQRFKTNNPEMKVLSPQTKITFCKYLLFALMFMRGGKLGPFGIGVVSPQTCLLSQKMQNGSSEIVFKIKPTYVNVIQKISQPQTMNPSYTSPETLENRAKQPDYFDSLWGVAMTVFYLVSPNNNHFFESVFQNKSYSRKDIIEYARISQGKADLELKSQLRPKIRTNFQKVGTVLDIQNSKRLAGDESALPDCAVQLLKSAIQRRYPDDSIYRIISINQLKKQEEIQLGPFSKQQHDFYQNLMYFENSKQFRSGELCEKDLKQFQNDPNFNQQLSPAIKSINFQVGEDFVEIFKSKDQKICSDMVYVTGKFMFMYPNGTIGNELFTRQPCYRIYITIKTNNQKQESRVIFLRKNGFHWLKANRMIYTQTQADLKWQLNPSQSISYTFDATNIFEPSSNNLDKLIQKTIGIKTEARGANKQQTYLELINDNAKTQLNILLGQELTKKNKVQRGLVMKLSAFISFTRALQQIPGKIQQLNLSNNKLGDDIMRVISNNRFSAFENIETLSLADNLITTAGMKKLFDSAKIYKLLLNLRKLKLSNNKIDSCQCIGVENCICVCRTHHPHLCHCGSKCNALGVECRSIAFYFPALQCLDLDMNEIETVDQKTFGCLKKIKMVDLSNNFFIKDTKNRFLWQLIEFCYEKAVVCDGIRKNSRPETKVQEVKRKVVDNR